MESRKYNSLFQYPTQNRKDMANETVRAYFEIYVEPNLKKLIHADDSINIMEILYSQKADNEVKFSEYIDSEYMHQGREFRSVLKVLRRLFYGDLDEYDPLMISLINLDRTLGVKKANPCEYNEIITKIMRYCLACYFQGETSDLTGNKLMAGS